MSENEIDLDDVEIVNVTGRAHHDRPRKHDEGNCACKQSIRVTTIIIFVCLLLVYGLHHPPPPPPPHLSPVYTCVRTLTSLFRNQFWL